VEIQSIIIVVLSVVLLFLVSLFVAGCHFTIKKRNYWALLVAIPSGVLGVVIAGLAIVLFMAAKETVGTLKVEARHQEAAYQSMGTYLAEHYSGLDVLILHQNRAPGDAGEQEIMGVRISMQQPHIDDIESALVPVCNSLTKAPVVSADALELLDVVDEHLMHLMSMSPVLRDFEAVLAAHPDADLIISTVPLPPGWQRMKCWSLPKDERPVWAMMTMSVVGMEEEIASGDIVAAVAMQASELMGLFGQSAAPSQSGAPQAPYVLVTPENVDELRAENPDLFRGTAQLPMPVLPQP
jgi:hypothetical protein